MPTFDEVMALHETDPDAAWELAEKDFDVFKQYIMATYEIGSDAFNEALEECKRFQGDAA
jgi:hypothetical protein